MAGDKLDADGVAFSEEMLWFIDVMGDGTTVSLLLVPFLPPLLSSFAKMLAIEKEPLEAAGPAADEE